VSASMKTFAHFHMYIPAHKHTFVSLNTFSCTYTHFIHIQITSLPSEVSLLQNLHLLSLDQNCLVTLPPEIGALSMLYELYLAGNRLTSLPGTIRSLRVLTVLNVTNNKIEDLPGEWSNQMTKLTHLDISCNRFAHVPAVILTFSQVSE
jgi:internalin A